MVGRALSSFSSEVRIALPRVILNLRSVLAHHISGSKVQYHRAYTKPQATKVTEVFFAKLIARLSKKQEFGSLPTHLLQ